MSRRHHRNPNRFKLLPIHDAPFYGYILEEDDRCPELFPDCPTIRCQKRIHSKTYVCHAVCTKPYYYSLFWQAKGERKER